MTNDLLPCPFCGGEAAIITKSVKMDCPDAELEFWKKIVCSKCEANTGFYDDRSHGPALSIAVSAWNTRTPNKSAEVDLEQLKRDTVRDLSFNEDGGSWEMCELIWAVIDHLSKSGHLATGKGGMMNKK